VWPVNGKRAIDMSGEIVHHAFVLPHWLYWTLILVVPPVFLYFAHRRAAADAALRTKDRITLTEEVEDGAKKADWEPPGNWLTRAIDATCYGIGVFVSVWTIITVSFYVFEVISRYFFGAPTNWAHEGSFLLFGVMYTLGGAALYLVDGHVRVDVFYAKWSRRGRAAADIVAAPIVCIFVLGFLVSGWLFFAQGLDRAYLPEWLALGYNMDISQTEWQIPYWPIKFTIPLGAFLVGLVALSRFVKDVQTFRHFSEIDDAQ
jgi:TRAP-type mannitol/chloroaromatic compound transport system permease small subunit